MRRPVLGGAPSSRRRVPSCSAATLHLSPPVPTSVLCLCFQQPWRVGLFSRPWPCCWWPRLLLVPSELLGDCLSHQIHRAEDHATARWPRRRHRRRCTAACLNLPFRQPGPAAAGVTRTCSPGWAPSATKPSWCAKRAQLLPLLEQRLVAAAAAPLLAWAAPVLRFSCRPGFLHSRRAFPLPSRLLPAPQQPEPLPHAALLLLRRPAVSEDALPCNPCSLDCSLSGSLAHLIGHLCVCVCAGVCV